MATYQLTMPDGRAFEVDGPEGMTSEQVWQAVNQNLQNAPLADYSKPESEIRSAIAQLPEQDKQRAYRQWARRGIAKERAAGLETGPSLARGIPVIGGLVDEGAALADAGLHQIGKYFGTDKVGRPYDEALAFQRERHRQAEAASPVEATVGQLATGIATGGPIFSRLAPARTALGRAGQGGTIGGTVGGVEGFTRGEGSLGNRLSNAGRTAMAGTLVGGGLPIAADAVKRGVGAVAENVGPTWTRLTRGPGEAADDILANRMYREGMTPAQARLDLQRGQAQSAVMQGGGAGASRAQLPESIADTSDSMQRLAGTLYRTGGAAGNFVRETLDNRQRGLANLFERITREGTDGQHQRIMNATERALLVRTAGTARQTERQITNQMRADGDRLYNVAYQTSEPFSLASSLRLFQMRMREYQPSKIRRAMNQALRLFSDNTPGSNPITNIKRFDKAKRALDDMIETAQKRARGANLVRELTMFKNNLLRNVHRNGSNANYQAARDAWGSAAERREAIELGRAALRENSEVSAEQFRELTTGQQQLFRLGFLESLRNAIGPKGRGHDITRVFDSNRVRSLMADIIPRSQRRADVFYNRPDRFGDLIEREGRMVQTRNAAIGNSMTRRNQADDAIFAGEALQSMWDRFRQSPSLFNMGIEAIGTGIQRVFGYRQDVALALAQRLLEQNPTVRNQILRRLSRRAPDRFQSFADLLDRTNQGLIATVPGRLQIENQD